MEPGRSVALIEDSLFFGDPHHPARFHQQKLVLHRSTLKSIQADLKDQGWKTRYYDYDPPSTIREVVQSLQNTGFSKLITCDPVDFLLSKRLHQACTDHGLELEVIPSPLFLNSRDWNRVYFADRQPRMASFYSEQRKRLDILMDSDGKPQGGRWSFDDENRKALPKDHQPPALPDSRLTEFDRNAIRYVEQHFPDNPGQADQFWFPSTSRAASRWLTRFLQERLDLFGDYEDALSKDHTSLYHSILTPMLNTGLLTPDQVVRKTLAFADEHKVPLNSLEGFIRQIIGWREFMRAMYENHGVEARTRNFWKFERPLPPSFYTGKTGILPVDLCIQRARDHAYCHHIERLMVLGNFMFLCRIRPDDVYRWFMEMFIDAYDWVMVPNVYSMSQFADGGIFTTKPYFSGSNYIRKMSDFPKGEWCDTWDALFWTFIEDHKTFFTSQPRLSMMTRTLDRMKPEKREAHRKTARAFLDNLT